MPWKNCARWPRSTVSRSGNLALAWLIAQPQTNAIVGARNAEQAAQNALAGDVEIDQDDLEAIDEIGRTVTDRLDKNPVMWG